MKRGAMSQKIKITLNEANKVLAYFDPTTLLIKLNISDDDIPTFERNPLKILRKFPTSVIVHELSHFFQTTGTSNGLRLFMFLADSLTIKFHIIKEVVRLCDGELTAPIFRNLPRPLDPNSELTKNLSLYAQVIVKQLSHYGGWDLEPEILRSAKKLASFIYRGETKFFQLKIYPLLMDMRSIDRTQRVTVFGARHIREGTSKALELIQAHLKKEVGLRAYAPKDKDSTGFTFSDVLSSMDPYFLSLYIYQNFVNNIRGCEENSSLEEFVAISDLALMGDIWICNWTQLQNLDSKETDKKMKMLDQIDYDCTPAKIFMHLLNTFSSSWTKLKRLTGNFSQIDVLNFQNELLQLSGGLQLEEIVTECEAYIEKGFINLKKGCPIPTTVLELYQNIFREVFNFRKKVLHNGALILDLLTSDRYVYDFFLSFVPAYIVGSNIYSSSSSRLSDIGVGLDLLTLRQIQDLTNAFLLGNKACPIHVEKPRSCVFYPSDSCNYVFKLGNDMPKCIREQTYRLLLEGLNIKNLKWHNN